MYHLLPHATSGQLRSRMLPTLGAHSDIGDERENLIVVIQCGRISSGLVASDGAALITVVSGNHASPALGLIGVVCPFNVDGGTSSFRAPANAASGSEALLP